MAITPVFLPGEAHGERSLVGYSPWASLGKNTGVRRDLATKPSPWSHLPIISIQITLTGLKKPLCGLCSSFLPPLPHNHGSSLCLQHFAFSRSHMGFSFFRWTLTYSNMHLSFFYIFSWLNFFLVLGNSSLSVCVTVHPI